MAFRTPTFNLTVNMWRFPNVFANPPTATFQANLSHGKRIMLMTGTILANPGKLQHNFKVLMELLCPKLTDLVPSDYQAFGPIDMVEVPAGSGRFYYVYHVDDVGKGFLNEYRLATLLLADAWIEGIYGNPFGHPPLQVPMP